MMKNLSHHVAFVVSFLAGFRLLVEELTRSGFIGIGGPATGWLETLTRVALTPLPVSNFGILVFALSILGILYVLGRTTERAFKQRDLPSTPRRERMPETQHPVSLPENQTITKECVDAEWNDLEEADKEAIREIIVQGGLWESDIIALLRARGLLSHHSRHDPLAERVSFVQSDYAGYYSIQPEYQELLENILAKDYAEETL